ncbi:MAG TPA: sensor histidine kinase [Iamia sp.]|nr:sensor histidine kinase [Iamia sp.]
MDGAPSTQPTGFKRPGLWLGWAHMFSMPFALTLFVLDVVGFALIPVTAGIPILAVSLPLTVVLAGLHRRMAALTLGRPVPALYRTRDAPTALGRLRQRGTDPQTWRDVLWLFLTSTIGFVLATFAVSAFLAIIWYLIYPFLVWVTPDGILDQPYGELFTIDTVPEAMAQWLLAGVAFALWWVVVPPLMRAKASIDAAVLGPTEAATRRVLEARVEELATTRSETVDVQAAELRRIERNLHDGAQARLVASGMTMGLALDLMESDPEQARVLMAEAQETNRDALADLRTVVRGIHPPVLSDRGLVGAVEALALQMSLTVDVTAAIGERLPAPVESAAYFAVAECLTNAAKHAGARRVDVVMARSDDVLRVVVTDDGRGGARIDPDGGLAGIERRLAVFDGTMHLDSPAGGPTRVTLAVPCGS